MKPNQHAAKIFLGLMIFTISGCWTREAPKSVVLSTATNTQVLPTATETAVPTLEPTSTSAPSALPTAAPNTRVSSADNMTLVYVPAGEFIMGSNDGDIDEKPERTVHLDAFWIDLTEVTQGMYAKCTAKGCKKPTCTNGDANHPVICVDWANAKSYCEWAGRRLLTEAEWEKAARGTDGRTYPWGNEPASCEYAVLDDLVNGNGCGMGNSAWAVGSKPKGASPYGVLDMAGNVWEWVEDWDPIDAANNSGRVMKGGGWFSIPETVRSASHEVLHPPVDKVDGLGFRCGTSE
jgi:eukaryotic-like serine/threonine-protein kinase